MAAERGHGRSRWIIAAISATVGLIAVALHAAAPASQPASPGKAANPHWTPDGCPACHGNAAQVRPVNRDRIDAMCLKCHDGRRAAMEIHPVGRRFLLGEIVAPANWPVPNDRLGCVTCHDIRHACDHANHRPEVNPQFLRTPPPGTNGGFCGACHIATARATGGRYNPHKMLNDKGEPIVDACLFCHASSLDLRNRTTRTGDAHLRADPIALCAACHPHHRDYFDPGHIGLQVTPQILARIVLAPPPATLPASWPDTQPAGRVRTRLPLQEGRRIVCFTCHNPHPQGVFAAGSELSHGEMSESSHNRLALRGPDKDVCRVCHYQ